MKDHQPNQCSRAGRRTPAVLLVALALQSGLLPGSEIGSAASVAANPAGKLAEPARADDRLSRAAFADPPIQNRPGCFWAWLNGSITAEQVTRDLEAMKRYGILPAEFDAEKKDVDTYDLDWKYWQQFWYQTGGPVE